MLERHMGISIIQTGGTHYQVGYQIGLAAGTSLTVLHEEMVARYGAKWPPLIAASRGFLGATERELPQVVEELRGCAAGAGIPFDDLFLMSLEELLYEEVRGESAEPDSPTLGERKASGAGCSDLAAGPPATADGAVWLAHNNDLGQRSREHLYVTRFCAAGEPEILAVTIGGIFISIGLNEAGISLTGDQLYANDSRVGVPRLLVVRQILAQPSFEAALQAALLPSRASSYNNLIASRDGRIVNVEGSATDYELLWAAGGATVHTNHYLASRMKQFEPANYWTAPSAARCARGYEYRSKYHGRISKRVCERFLRDHVYAPWSVCKHAGDAVTVFSAIINLNRNELWLTDGNPCESEYALYGFN
jgi:isopenicillin-N N-acyltransferase like protein